VLRAPELPAGVRTHLLERLEAAREATEAQSGS
jgi:hypothetical protein